VNDRVVRISGMAVASASSGDVSLLRLSFYKDSTLTSPTFHAIPNSVIQYDTIASPVVPGTLVFDYYGASGGSATYPTSVLTFIPREAYSVIIAPGEYVTITDTTSTSHTLYCTFMWEEIIN
jgi:hypothetical protein